MAALNETVRGKIVDYDEQRGELIIRAPYQDFPTMVRREYETVEIMLVDSRPLSSKQRRSCYAMIREIADWAGDDASEVKQYLKTDFWASELMDTADTMFSLSNAPMSIVAAFQRWLARFIVRHDVPCKKSLLSYVDDVDDYVYACIANKKCAICGRHADLHHVDPIGMGRDRETIIHEGMPVLPLCREHHTETHGMSTQEFLKKYHLNGGIPADKTICKLYRLKARKE